MGSAFDAMYGAWAAPSLMSTLGTEGAVTVISGGVTVLDQADAIVRHSEISDVFDDRGEMKVHVIQVDVFVDDSLDHGGLEEAYTNAKVDLYEVGNPTPTNWDITRVLNKTETWQRLELRRVLSRNVHRSGFYRT